MKKCPFCGAQIEDNAKFCLYCMHPLQEKEAAGGLIKPKSKRLVPVAVIAVCLAAVITALAVAAAHKNPGSAEVSPSPYPAEQTYPGTVNPSELPTRAGNDDRGEAYSAAPTAEASSSDPAGTNTPLTNSPGTTAPGHSSTPAGTTPETKQTDTPSAATTVPTSSATTEVKMPTPAGKTSAPTATTVSETPTPAPTVTYLFRNAVPSDDYASDTSVTQNAVVIIGVQNASPDGTYTVPAAINGKKVVAVMQSAFCDASIKDTVKKVILPASVQTIHTDAFGQCYNLTDLYFSGEAVGANSAFLPPTAKRNFTLTIHCSSTCHGRNGITYKSMCTLYMLASYAEWNG